MIDDKKISEHELLTCVYAELRLHIHTLQQVLIRKGLASEEDMEDVMTPTERKKMEILLVQEFAEKIRRIVRKRPLPRAEPDSTS